MDGGYSPWNQPRIIDRNRNGNIVSLPTSWRDRVAEMPVGAGLSPTHPAPLISATSTGATQTMPRSNASPVPTPAVSGSATASAPRDSVCDPVAFWRGLGVGLLIGLVVFSALVAAILQ